MAISGNLRISASLVSPYHRHPKCLSLPSSKVRFLLFLTLSLFDPSIRIMKLATHCSDFMYFEKK
ncbi:hypothetical protein Bca52824_052548 [Brassica carinata]|uniref:Uncharacterized protein n=1 Tax=Brassica carinata TaxID=52824 RepID=A0A8X7R7H2_BRACI|nr:hypothetical protein Bca52824_052548 [Brassica carinata]